MAQHHGASDGRRESVVGQDHPSDDLASVSEPVRAVAAFTAMLDRPSLRLRLRVCARAGALDNELAGGASPLHSRELALRARQLVNAKSREVLASALESLCEHAERAASSTAIVPLPRREITESRASLLALALRLRDPRPVYARGAAMVSVLVRDGTGPALTPGAGLALRRSVRAATEALDGTWQAQ